MSQDLLVGGISLAGFIVLVVQALKVSGVQDEKWLGLSPWLTAFVFLVLFGAQSFFPAAAPVIKGVLEAIVGAAGAVLGYFYALKPVGQALGRAISSADLQEK